MSEISRSALRQVWWRLSWVTLYASAMGLLESICVIYLRRLIVPDGGDLSQAMAQVNRLPVESIREAATIVMLIAVAWLAGSNARQRIAHFFLMFGVWDILYYVGLKWLADWPSSWLEWDCLFLIPKPWHGPVLAPVLVSAYFVVACGWLLIREACPAPLRISFTNIALQLAAFVVWYWSFVKDSDLIRTSGYTATRYSWGLFACGLAIGMIGLFLAGRGDKTRVALPNEASA